MYSSSGSEDDCYGDVAKKLEKLKNNYRDDKFESAELLDESAELLLETCNINRDFRERVTGNVIIRKGTDACKEDEEQEEGSFGTKRLTRSSVRKENADLAVDMCGSHAMTRTTSKGSGRNRKSADRNVIREGRGRRSAPLYCMGYADEAADVCALGATTRSSSSKGRGRNRKSTQGNYSRGRRGCRSAPVYFVGDAEEYPDQSQCLGLFSKVTDDVVLVEDNDALEQNEELSVKVCWRSDEYCTFTIRKHQKLSLIFRHFAEKGNVSEDRLLFIYNDKILKPDDTPDSIQYNIAKFIEAGVVSHDVTNLHNSDQQGQGTGLQIKFQSHNSKKPIEITIQPNENLSMAMIKCAEQLEQPLNNLKFFFDGYAISGATTAQQLELEGGECIDVKLL